MGGYEVFNEPLNPREYEDLTSRLREMCPHSTHQPFFAHPDVIKEQRIHMGPYQTDKNKPGHSIVMNHVPKTAGSSTLRFLRWAMAERKAASDRSIMYQEASKGGCYFLSGGCPARTNNLTLHCPIAKMPNCDIAYGHFDFTFARQMYELDPAFGRPIVVSTLRHPMKRLISAYEHWHRYTQGRGDQSLKAWVQRTFSRDNDGFERWFMMYYKVLRDLQTRMVAGVVTNQDVEMAELCGLQTYTHARTTQIFTVNEMRIDDHEALACYHAGRTQLVNRDSFHAYREAWELDRISVHPRAYLEEAKFNLCNSYFVLLERPYESYLVIARALQFPEHKLETMTELPRENTGNYSKGQYDLESLYGLLSAETAIEEDFFNFATELLQWRLHLLRPRPVLDLLDLLSLASQFLDHGAGNLHSFFPWYAFPATPERYSFTDLTSVHINWDPNSTIGYPDDTEHTWTSPTGSSTAGHRKSNLAYWLAYTHRAEYLYMWTMMIMRYSLTGTYGGWKVKDILYLGRQKVSALRQWAGYLKIDDHTITTTTASHPEPKTWPLDKRHFFLVGHFEAEGLDEAEDHKEFAIDFGCAKLDLFTGRYAPPRSTTALDRMPINIRWLHGDGYMEKWMVPNFGYTFLPHQEMPDQIKEGFPLKVRCDILLLERAGLLQSLVEDCENSPKALLYTRLTTSMFDKFEKLVRANIELKTMSREYEDPLGREEWAARNSQPTETTAEAGHTPT